MPELCARPSLRGAGVFARCQSHVLHKLRRKVTLAMNVNKEHV